MSIALTTPVTGAAQTGLTSPTYTIVSDVAPDMNGKQYAVTALGGTQTSVTAHTATTPFTVTYTRPKVLRMLPALGNNGQFANIPNNTHKLLVRKGVVPASGQPSKVAMVSVEISVPAGAETYDAQNVRAMLSAAIGSLSQLSAGIGDTVVTNVM